MGGNKLLALGLAFVLALASMVVGYHVVTQAAAPVSHSSHRTPQPRQFRTVLFMLEDEFGNEYHMWMPNTLVVNAGDTVILQVTNGDEDAAHGFGLAANWFGQESFNIDERLEPGQTVTLQFVAKSPGIFPFYCTVAGCAADHAEQTGLLVVLGD